MSQPVILFVDDEKSILKSLQRLFISEDYDVNLANSGKEALEMIDKGLNPTVIVSDQRMPEMGGAEFLAKAKEKAPDSIRMVLTGYADITAAMDAINLGGIYRYLVKPWNDDDLKLSVQDAIERYNLVEENRRLTRELKEMNEELEKKVAQRTAQLQFKLKELEGRDRIQQHLMTIHPIEESMSFILEVIATVIRLKCAATYLPSGDGKGVNVTATLPENFPAGSAAFSEQVALVMKDGESKVAIIDSEALDNEIEELTVAVLPITVPGQILGAILIGRNGEAKFGSAELHTMEGFAMQAAIAVKDANMGSQLPELESNLDDILKELKG
ncbi:MAG: response regulator [Proteobacteria bacterium]|nr:response regulator [Pseudomonadota bacterium]MBU1738491.1 response regulator [Pseudomonadota bacterium]